MFFFFSIFKDSQTNARGQPIPPLSTPQYDVILKCMRLRYFPLQGFYDFIVPLFEIYKKPCKTLFALKFKVSEWLNFVYQSCYKIAYKIN